MKKNRTERGRALVPLVMMGWIFVAGCGGDRQEDAVNSLFEENYAFTVEEFFRAAQAGDVEAVRWFLAAGMNVGVGDVAKSQALHFAAGAGRSEVVAELLRRGSDPGSERGDGRTALMLAAEAGDGRSVELLVNAGSPVTGKDRNGWSALALAAYVGCGRAVEALVPLSGPYLNDALMLAAMGGHVGAIDPLVAGAAVVDVRSPDNRTPLMLAASRGHEDAVKFLLYHGANWYVTDAEENTASQLAAASGFDSIVTLLESAHLTEDSREVGDASFVPEETGGAVLYSSRTRRIDGEGLIGQVGDALDLGDEVRFVTYRERQLPIYFHGSVDADGREAEVRLLFGEHATYRVRKGETIPRTHLEVIEIEVHWSSGKESQGKPQRVARLVVKDVLSNEVIGVTADDPGRSAKSFALLEHHATGQIYEARRGDRFKALGDEFSILDLRDSEVLVENLSTGVVTSLKRAS